jgi:hypothetical protein
VLVVQAAEEKGLPELGTLVPKREIFFLTDLLSQVGQWTAFSEEILKTNSSNGSPQSLHSYS